MHLFKDCAPFAEGRKAIEYRIQIDLAACQKGKDLFPNHPIMGIAALKSDCLLDELIERKIQRLRSPSHFSDLARRSDNVERLLERSGNAGSVNHKVDSVTIVKILDPLGNVLSLRAKNRICTNLFGDLKPFGIGGNADHDEMPCSGKS